MSMTTPSVRAGLPTGPCRSLSSRGTTRGRSGRATPCTSRTSSGTTSTSTAPAWRRSGTTEENGNGCRSSALSSAPSRTTPSRTATSSISVRIPACTSTSWDTRCVLGGRIRASGRPSGSTTWTRSRIPATFSTAPWTSSAPVAASRRLCPTSNATPSWRRIARPQRALPRLAPTDAPTSPRIRSSAACSSAPKRRIAPRRTRRTPLRTTSPTCASSAMWWVAGGVARDTSARSVLITSC
mmetsp:Transcript_143595/g.459322  ORF Transcript_143595/g.459322 Transcript_143595/m.459322 type:complete len:240 (+) Transcript_143595:188-907(+)